MRRGALLVTIVGLVVTVGLTGAYAMAQITPDPDGPVDYGPTITTDREKLYACYALNKQMIDEYNRQSGIALSDRAKYEAKFRHYVHEEFQPRLAELLAERDRVKEAVRVATYTAAEWRDISALPAEEYYPLMEELYGSKQAEEDKPTLATAAVLDELKDVVLDSLPGEDGGDPTEDLTTYTEVDAGFDLTVTTDKVDAVVHQARRYEGYVVDSKGSGHFSGDYEHRIKGCVTSCTNWVWTNLWMLANVEDDGQDIDANDEDFHSYFIGQWSGTFNAYLQEQVGVDKYSDGFAPTKGTVYFYTLDRNEGEETYGKLYNYVCTGNYYGESGSSLEATLSLVLHEKEDFEYVYAYNAHCTDSNPEYNISCYTELLDLQEAAAAATHSFGYILGGDV